MTFFGTLASPVGVLGVESDGEAIRRVGWMRAPAAPPHDPLLVEALRQLEAYFAGALTVFDVPIAVPDRPESTHAVLRTLHETVGFGESVTYGELADRSGTDVPARAIGSIMGANPIPIIVPCHRVVASDGLGGFSGGAPGQGLATKRWLLEHEGVLPPALF
ncbi:methylated-DNA--[protein]-cysteine S-methyltransferase [Microbacterium sp. ASV49]|uniref:Methylated-DNA--protein-cysteine methyltransferase n=1 Tax=Microbacterium candidum TaxID=3041922 RepID=A0ABT7N2B5_9MICO|nr:methylated-DNA--[protein]-cysteine S-methyltransferase [Microbacterium sp. ASV49]MDL9980805.1 methylated-DNA--[protein]-cysteine S-methyltransferase [Microbacterium sp. ASV49]